MVTYPARVAPTSRSPLADREETRARILDAARGCFRRRGAQRTTMEDVAKASGTSRQNLYRFFSGREELVEAAIVERIGELAGVLQQDMDQHTSFADALVEMSVATVEIARTDEELHRLFAAAGEIHLHQVLAGPYPPIAQLVLEFWRPWFERARREGEMRTDVSDADVIEWIRGTYLMLILRDDLTPERERQLIRQFLLPALTPGRTRSSRPRGR
jgi:AcrR family transcriptional regulator